jgi:hypothetical protein
MLKTDTKKAFLNGDIGDEAPDWRPKFVSEGPAILFMKNKYFTQQAARQWHQRILGWLELHRSKWLHGCQE